MVRAARMATAETLVDINYLFLRQQTERSRAATATSEVARKIHEQLANQYERLIEDATCGRVSFVRPMLEQPAVRGE